jgi:hypothetical protein
MDVAEFIAQPPQSCQIRALRSAVIDQMSSHCASE